jgi:hypothetical protein
MNYPFVPKLHPDFECDDDIPAESFWKENDEWTMMHVEKHYFQSETLEYYPSDWHPAEVLGTTKSWQHEDIEVAKMRCFLQTIPFDVPFVFPVHQNEYRDYLNDRGVLNDEILPIEGTEDMGGTTGTPVEPLTNEMTSFIDKLLGEYELFAQSQCIASKNVKPVTKKSSVRRKPKQKIKNVMNRLNKKTRRNAANPLNKPTRPPQKPAFKSKKEAHYFNVSV